MQKNKEIAYDLEEGEYEIVTLNKIVKQKHLSKKIVFLLSFILGVILTTAFAPYNCILSLIISFSGYYFLTTQYINRKDALISGYLFGFGYYLSSLYWFSSALLVQAEKFAWLIPFALTLIPSILALYFVATSWLVFKFKDLKFHRYLAFCCIITIGEYLRSFFIIPFPWNNFPYTLANWDALLQISYYLNQLTITFLLVFFGSLLHNFTKARVALVMAFFLALYTFGNQRIKSSNYMNTDYIIRVVQPNFGVHHFGNRELQIKYLSALAKLSTENPTENLKAIVWPESAFPYLIGYGSYRIKILSALAPQNGYLITGADTYDENGSYYNSIVAIDDKWMIANRHDKKYLVPFGEYIPMRKFLPFIDKIAYGMGEFSVGTNQNSFKESDEFLHYVGLVCYEIIFPLSEHDSQNARWILNVTNDSWFGQSIGPYQHLAMAKYKAAEYGIPVVRAANTGISSVFSPYGEFLLKTDLNQQKVVDFKLPTRIAINYGFLKKSSILLWILLLIVCISREKSLRIWWEK